MLATPPQRTRKTGGDVGGRLTSGWLTDAMAVTIYGVCAVTFMMVMYALEGRGRGFVLAFAFGCVLSSVYGFLSGAWPFGVVELIWAGIAVRRYQQLAPA
jgi:hypothetical protein